MNLSCETLSERLSINLCTYKLALGFGQFFEKCGPSVGRYFNIELRPAGPAGDNPTTFLSDNIELLMGSERERQRRKASHRIESKS